MNKRVLTLIAVCGAAGLVSTGCSCFGHKSQGAPVAATTTETVVASSPAPAVETRPEAEIQLYKEEMVVGKKEINNGGVLIRKVVTTENVSQPVTLAREEYVVERVPAGENAKAAENAFKGEEIYIPLTREEAVAGKKSYIAEKVEVGKKTSTETQTLSVPIRTEDVEITKNDAKATGTGPYRSEAATTGAPATSDANSISLVQEELVVGKATIDNGGVKVRKIVKTETASQPVELKREELVLNRVPQTDKTAATSDFSQKEIRVNLIREEAVAGTRAVPTEFVRIKKQIQTENKTIDGTVRKENVEIVKLNPETTSVGGTGSEGKSGVSTLSGSNEVIIAGKAMCTKCQLHQTADCENVIQVKEDGKKVNYYLTDNQATKDFHDTACKAGKKAEAVGTLEQKDGKFQFTATKITILN
jgi:uncharacterized protein (TIGR02271 family)